MVDPLFHINTRTHRRPAPPATHHRQQPLSWKTNKKEKQAPTITTTTAQLILSLRQPTTVLRSNSREPKLRPRKSCHKFKTLGQWNGSKKSSRITWQQQVPANPQ